MVEYWRWWVVHLWVEGFFEVFATDGHRLLLHAAEPRPPRRRGGGGVALGHDLPGRRHHRHLPPPVLLGHADRRPGLGLGVQRPGGRAAGPRRLRGMEDLRLSRATPWVQQYKWPIYFFVAVAFWNMVGAGLFGFMINPPIALYYMQGLNTTPVHGHAALFGVYGMLGIGLMLFCLRASMPGRGVEGGAAQVLLLGDQRRADGDVRAEPAAGRPDADLGLGGARLLVRPQPRVPARRGSCRRCAGCGCRATRSSAIGAQIGLRGLHLGLGFSYSDPQRPSARPAARAAPPVRILFAKEKGYQDGRIGVDSVGNWIDDMGERTRSATKSPGPGNWRSPISRIWPCRVNKSTDRSCSTRAVPAARTSWAGTVVASAGLVLGAPLHRRDGRRHS